MPQAKCGKPWFKTINHKCKREKKADGSDHDGACECQCGETN